MGGECLPLAALAPALPGGPWSCPREAAGPGRPAGMSEMGVTWDAATFLPPPCPLGAVSGPWPIQVGAHEMAVASLSLGV